MSEVIEENKQEQVKRNEDEHIQQIQNIRRKQ